MLVVAGTGAEEVAELVVASTEALRCSEALEAPHTSCAPFHAPMILFQSVILVYAGPVHDVTPQCRADGTRVGAVPVRGDTLGRDTGDRLGRAEEGLGCGHVAVFAEHGVDQPAVTVDGAIQIAPPATNLQVRLVHMPVPTTGAAPTAPALAELVGQQWRELRLPLADCFVTEDDAADQEHLGQVAQGQAVAQLPQHHQGDDVRGVVGVVQYTAAALVVLFAALAAAEPAVA